MMPTGWGFFPWPVLLVIPMIAMAVFTAVRLTQRRGPGCGFLAPPSPAATVGAVAPPPAEDPLVILRERFARGEIDLSDLEARTESLLRSDPNQSIPWQDPPATAASSGTTR